MYKNNKKQNSNHEIIWLWKITKTNGFYKIIEELDKKAKIIFRPMQRGDVKTKANNQKVINFTGYKPVTKIEDGIYNFIKWYKKYY